VSAPQTTVDAKLVDQLEHRLARAIGQTVERWNLIEEGDRIMVGISGGKDSYTLLHMLLRMQRIAPVRFEVLPFHLDQRQPGFPTEKVREYLESVGIPYLIHSVDTYSIVIDKLRPEQTTCALCSRLRRGIMYNQAVELGCTKIALGHHRDDSIETLLLNLFYSGQLKAMPAKLRSDDRRNVVIRPMITVPESLIIEFSEAMSFPTVPCTFCSTQPNHKRARLKTLLDGLEAENPNVRGNMLAALGKVVPSHLLDAKLLGGDSVTVSAEEFDEGLIL